MDGKLVVAIMCGSIVLATVLMVVFTPPGPEGAEDHDWYPSPPPRDGGVAAIEAKRQGKEHATMTMTLTSSAFKHGEPIPIKHTGDGADRSPALAWRNVPDGTRSLALIVDDPDAPTSEPWVHWVIWNIPAHAMGMPEGVARNEKLVEPAGALQGVNSWPSDNLGYRGPAPPSGHGTHRYHFRLFALDAMLDLSAGATKQQLLDALAEHTLATTELIGTYERK